VSTTLPPRSESALGSEPALLERYDILCVRADNPGPFTLSGTNTWLVGRSPAWLIDPGPLQEEHLQRLARAIELRGGLGGIALTHDHRDHSEAVATLRADHPAPLAAARGEVDVPLAEGAHFGPFEAVATPGHAPDHIALVASGACFSGDAVLGEGSVFVSPYRGAMTGYLEGLERLRARRDLEVICPGHGPAVWDPREKLAEYIEHRADRERRLVASLEAGLRSTQQLLDAVWPEVPPPLRGAARVTLEAHLDKLDAEGRLPEGVERAQREAGFSDG
jgi:glyoxylase-like metal-dependent hydrolase (beta-lactamase superfamily II)